MKCKCGGERFSAHQICRHDVVVDENGSWLSDSGVYDSGKPYGPFTCKSCGQEYDELPTGKDKEVAAFMIKKMFSM